MVVHRSLHVDVVVSHVAVAEVVEEVSQAFGVGQRSGY